MMISLDIVEKGSQELVREGVGEKMKSHLGSDILDALDVWVRSIAHDDDRRIGNGG